MCFAQRMTLCKQRKGRVDLNRRKDERTCQSELARQHHECTKEVVCTTVEEECVRLGTATNTLRFKTCSHPMKPLQKKEQNYGRCLRREVKLLWRTTKQNENMWAHNCVDA